MSVMTLKVVTVLNLLAVCSTKTSCSVASASAAKFVASSFFNHEFTAAPCVWRVYVRLCDRLPMLLAFLQSGLCEELCTAAVVCK
jgi:hypothetical protein